MEIFHILWSNKLVLCDRVKKRGSFNTALQEKTWLASRI